ncbi:EAL domain-containing protein [Aestuariicella sp. G3-2]|uniref:putative bifunctional diguanylate cyclase/phosphodiesterase n=1 Tax=Pseudomaricurvus albidus TaxID=2842452 RepID=UPI001C0C5F03|nr:EAL domain-containing protein [Aestuariicella albida]
MIQEQPQSSNVIESNLGSRLLEQMADRLSDLVLGVNLDGSLYYVSPSVEQLLGYSNLVFQRLYNQALEYQELSCHDDQRFSVLQRYLQRQLATLSTVPPEDTSQRSAEGLHRGEHEEATSEVLQVSHRDGFRVSLNLQVVPLVGRDGVPEGLICIGCDVGTRKHSSEAMALAMKVFENNLTAIYITNAQGAIVQANQAFVRLTGYSLDEVIGESPRLMDVNRYTQSYFQSIHDNLERKDFWEGEIQHRRKDGRVFPAWVAISVLRDHNRKVVNTISYFSDITEKKHSDTLIHRLAYFDSLTGLPNRTLLRDRLKQSTARARRAGQQVALLLLDLDHLKQVNDRFGHALGDSLLQQVAQRLQDCVRDEDTVARVGGDEFAVLVSGLADRVQAVTAVARLSETICHRLTQSFTVGAEQIDIGVRAGIAFYPADGSEADTLLRNTDTALYHAKTVEGRHYCFYNKAMNAKVEARAQLEREFRQAMKLQSKAPQFELVYQPILGADDGKTHAVEALVRWQHPERGMLLPKDFLSIAESTGLIRSLGDWVLRQACRQWLLWRDQGVPVGRVAVNVSRGQFEGGHLLRALRDIMQAYAIPAGVLELELTEETLACQRLRIAETLDEIRRLGVSVSLDDFGTGYSCVQQMKRLPVDNLKVSRSFMEALPAHEDQCAIRAIVALARNLDMKVIAEGVETPMQLEFVQQLECDEVQGFFLSRPVSAQEILSVGDEMGQAI